MTTRTRDTVLVFLAVGLTVIGLIALGCTTVKPGNPPLTTIKGINLEEDATNLQDSTSAIRGSTKKVESRVADDRKMSFDLRPEFENMYTNLGKQDAMVLDLRAEAKVKDIAITNATKVDNAKDSEISELKKKLEDKNGWLWAVLAIAAPVLLAAGITMTFTGNWRGTAVAIFGLALGSGTLIFGWMNEHRGVVCLISGILIAIGLVWLVLRKQNRDKSLADRFHDAFDDVVGFVDKTIKPVLPSEIKATIFGPPTPTLPATQTLSPETQDLVAISRGKA